MWRLVPRSAWHGGVRSLFGFDELGGLFQPNLFSVQRAQWKFMLLGDPYTGVKPFQKKTNQKAPVHQDEGRWPSPSVPVAVPLVTQPRSWQVEEAPWCRCPVIPPSLFPKGELSLLEEMPEDAGCG